MLPVQQRMQIVTTKLSSPSILIFTTSHRTSKASDMTSTSTVVIDHENWHQFGYAEEFTFSANGKNVYIKRTFENNQTLYWVADTDGYPLDQGTPSSARAYAAVNRSSR
jgi:hypothetical protein